MLSKKFCFPLFYCILRAGDLLRSPLAWPDHVAASKLIILAKTTFLYACFLEKVRLSQRVWGARNTAKIPENNP